jgi:hypothetical protein
MRKTYPDIVDGARTLAVDTLSVVGTNDHVGNNTSILDNQDGIIFSGLGLLLASAGAAIPDIHATIEGFTSSNSPHGREEGGTRSGREDSLKLSVGSLSGRVAREDDSIRNGGANDDAQCLAAEEHCE